jgi:hypothetical protein
MLSCKEVVAQGDALLSREVSLRQRIQIMLHLFVCEHCRRYLHQLEILLRSFRRLHAPVGADKVAEVMDAVHRG